MKDYYVTSFAGKKGAKQCSLKECNSIFYGPSEANSKQPAASYKGQFAAPGNLLEKLVVSNSFIKNVLGICSRFEHANGRI